MTALRRICIAVALAAVALVFAGAATAPASRAETAAELQKRLREARAKIDAAQKHKTSITDQIADLDTQLTQLEDRIGSLGDQIVAVEARLSTTRERLGVLREELRLKRLELAKAQAELAAEQDALAERVVLSYKSDDLDYIDVFLDSTSFEDLISRVGVVADLLQGDDEFVAGLELTRNAVRSDTNAVAAREQEVADAATELQEKTDELATLRAQQQASRADALAMRKEKRTTLVAVNQDLEELERQEDQLLAESAQLTGVIVGSSGSGVGTGHLMWPVQGTLSSPFGWRIHPILGYRKFHTGIDIGVGYGTPIHAADSGTVIYATWMGGYGNVVIIDHGGGISTLYAHQSRLAVGNGTRVARGQVIGYIGSTGLSTGPHLHFEVRLNGNPVDPLGYL